MSKKVYNELLKIINHALEVEEKEKSEIETLWKLFKEFEETHNNYSLQIYEDGSGRIFTNMEFDPIIQNENMLYDDFNSLNECINILKEEI